MKLLSNMRLEAQNTNFLMKMISISKSGNSIVHRRTIKINILEQFLKLSKPGIDARSKGGNVLSRGDYMEVSSSKTII